MRSEDDLKRWLRRVVLGVSATPLVMLPSCGRSDLLHDLSPDGAVIPSKDAGVDAGTKDAGVDAGTKDAGVDSGVPDGGWKIIWGCNGYASTNDGRVVILDGGGLADPLLCVDACPMDFNGLPLKTCQPEGTDQLICWFEFCGVGRLTDGLTPHAGGSGLGGQLANMAAHEAGAAVAFAHLGTELEHHGIAPALVRRARRAAREEQHHTRLVGALARAHGGRFSLTEHPPEGVRSLERIALENAAEGCVRETLGAMVGLFQAHHAADPRVRQVMTRVSADELGHAAWSHALAGALATRLPLAARRRVREARAQALAEAAAHLVAPAEPAVRAALGVPDDTRLNALVSALAKSP